VATALAPAPVPLLTPNCHGHWHGNQPGIAISASASTPNSISVLVSAPLTSQSSHLSLCQLWLDDAEFTSVTSLRQIYFEFLSKSSYTAMGGAMNFCRRATPPKQKFAEVGKLAEQKFGEVISLGKV